MTEPLLLIEPDADYRTAASEYLSSHALIEFIRSALIYHLKDTGVIPRVDKPVFAFGRGAHAFILEGEGAYEETYTVGDGPVNEKTGKPYGIDSKKHLAWREQQSTEIISTADDAKIRAMAASVSAHPVAAGLLADGQAEGVARQEFGGVPCQIRCDWFSGKTGLDDLKTCASLDMFATEMRKFGSACRRAQGPLPVWRLVDTMAGSYCVQMAFYYAVLHREFGEKPDVHLTAVEKVFPYRVGVWNLPTEMLEDLARFCEEHIARWAACKAKATWPSGFAAVRQLEDW